MAHIMSFSEYTAPAGSITESLTQRSAMIRFNRAMDGLRHSLEKGDTNMFDKAIGGFSDLLEDIYETKCKKIDCFIKVYFGWHEDEHIYKVGDKPHRNDTIVFDTYPVTDFNALTTKSYNGNDIAPEIYFWFEWRGGEYLLQVKSNIKCDKDKPEVFFDSITEQFDRIVYERAKIELIPTQRPSKNYKTPKKDSLPQKFYDILARLDTIPNKSYWTEVFDYAYEHPNRNGITCVRVDNMLTYYNCKKNEYATDMWFDGGMTPSDRRHTVWVKKNGKYNILDLTDGRLVLKNWVEYASDGYKGDTPTYFICDPVGTNQYEIDENGHKLMQYDTTKKWTVSFPKRS